MGYVPICFAGSGRDLEIDAEWVGRDPRSQTDSDTNPASSFERTSAEAAVTGRSMWGAAGVGGVDTETCYGSEG